MAHTHTCTANHTHTHTHHGEHKAAFAIHSSARTGNGNFCKCKSAGLKIQRINVHHMWHSGSEEDILTERVGSGGFESWEEGCSPGVSPAEEKGETRTHTHS